MTNINITGYTLFDAFDKERFSEHVGIVRGNIAPLVQRSARSVPFDLQAQSSTSSVETARHTAYNRANTHAYTVAKRATTDFKNNTFVAVNGRGEPAGQPVLKHSNSPSSSKHCSRFSRTFRNSEQ